MLSNCARAIRQGLGDLRQASGERRQPFGQRREIPGQQQVDGLARIGPQRVPRVLAQFVDLEDPARDPFPEHHGVHGEFGRQRRGIEGGQPDGEAVERLALGGARCRVVLGKSVVEPVVTEPGGRVGMTLRQVVEVVRGQHGELGRGWVAAWVAAWVPLRRLGRRLGLGWLGGVGAHVASSACLGSFGSCPWFLRVPER